MVVQENYLPKNLNARYSTSKQEEATDNEQSGFG